MHNIKYRRISLTFIVVGCLMMLALIAVLFKLSIELIILAILGTIIGIVLAVISKTAKFKRHIINFYGESFSESEIEKNRTGGYIGIILGFSIALVIKHLLNKSDLPLIIAFLAGGLMLWFILLARWSWKIENEIIAKNNSQSSKNYE